MIPKNFRPHWLPALSGLAGLLSLSLALIGPSTALTGCFSTENQPTTLVVHDTTHIIVIDSTKKNGGWDDFPNKAMPDLKMLATKLKTLPVPASFDYATTVKPQSKRSAAGDSCGNYSDLVSVDVAERGLTVVDTLRYYDAAGAGLCFYGPSLLRLTHNRYMLNGTSESWEAMEDTISQISTIPSQHIGCKGKIRLFNGVNLAIDSYSLDVKTPLGHPDALIFAGHLGLSWKDGSLVDSAGYRIDLEITKALPIKEADFFPARGILPAGEVVMSGPIKHGAIVVGYFDLYSDHSVMIRDWNKAAVTVP